MPMGGEQVDELLWTIENPQAAMSGLVVDFVCNDCGARVTKVAAWTRRPMCCDWEMIDLIGTVRPLGPCGFDAR